MVIYQRRNRFMEHDIDVNRLRRDMKDNYGTAMFNGFPMAIMDVTKVEKATDQEIISMARKQNINLSKYSK